MGGGHNEGDKARGRAAEDKEDLAVARSATDPAVANEGCCDRSPARDIPVRADGTRPVPLEVTLGRDGPRRTILDVTAAGSTCVTGSREAVSAWLEAAVGELVGSLGATGGRLVVAGSSDERGGLLGAGAPHPRGVEVVESSDAGAALGSCGPGTRAVVVVGPSVVEQDGAGVAALVAHCPGGGGAAVLFGGSVAAAAERVEAGGTPASEAVVNVLGPVVVHGAAGGLGRHPKLTELAVYLALHEEGAPSRLWADALWPERSVPPQTIANRLSELRRLLGFAPDGRPRLRRDGERHRLVDVRTDWSAARRLTGPSSGLEQWRAALGLVRGRPFTGLREASWTRVEGHEAEIERTITDCALSTCEELLGSGDAATATWAAEQGLLAVPWDERLHRALMRAGAAAGNLGKVDATLRHLALALEIEGDPLGAVHPDTARLYQQLSGRRRGGAR